MTFVFGSCVVMGGLVLAAASDRLPPYRASLELLAGTLLVSGLAIVGRTLGRCL